MVVLWKKLGAFLRKAPTDFPMQYNHSYLHTSVHIKFKQASYLLMV